MADITLTQAQQAVDAALNKADEMGVKMDVAVVDVGANLQTYLADIDFMMGSFNPPIAAPNLTPTPGATPVPTSIPPTPTSTPRPTSVPTPIPTSIPIVSDCSPAIVARIG